jgi:hypothetical protein
MLVKSHEVGSKAILFFAPTSSDQGCLMVFFQTKNPNPNPDLPWKLLVYFLSTWYTLCTAICHILWQFGIFYGNLVYFIKAIWYILLRQFGIFY